MPVVAVCWNVIFFLAVRETVRKAREIGPGNLRFLTTSPRVSWLLMLVGVVIGVGMLLVVLHAIAAGDVSEVCRRCFKQRFSYATSPVSYLLTVAALIELCFVGFFVVFLARNSLKAIRERG